MRGHGQAARIGTRRASGPARARALQTGTTHSQRGRRGGVGGSGGATGGRAGALVASAAASADAALSAVAEDLHATEGTLPAALERTGPRAEHAAWSPVITQTASSAQAHALLGRVRGRRWRWHSAELRTEDVGQLVGAVDGGGAR